MICIQFLYPCPVQIFANCCTGLDLPLTPQAAAAAFSSALASPCPSGIQPEETESEEDVKEEELGGEEVSVEVVERPPKWCCVAHDLNTIILTCSRDFAPSHTCFFVAPGPALRQNNPRDLKVVLGELVRWYFVVHNHLKVIWG